MRLYDLIKTVSDIITPGTDAFYNYVLHTSDDDGGFLRTRYCWKDKCVDDRQLSNDVYKKIMVTCESPIDISMLDKKDDTCVKLQFEYWCPEPTLEDAEWDAQLGYRCVYFFDPADGSYTMEYLEDPID